MTKTINAYWEQTSAQGFSDGTESGSSTKAAVNTGWTQNVDEIFHYRILIQETAGTTEAPTFAVRLQANINSGGWFNVTTSSSNVQIVASSNLTDGADTTQRIGADADYVANNNWVTEASGDTATTTDTFGTGTAADISECEALWSVQFLSTGTLQNGDTIQFQAIDTAGVALDNYATGSSFDITVAGLPALVTGTATIAGTGALTAAGTAFAPPPPYLPLSKRRIPRRRRLHH